MVAVQSMSITSDQIFSQAEKEAHYLICEPPAKYDQLSCVLWSPIDSRCPIRRLCPPWADFEGSIGSGGTLPAAFLHRVNIGDISFRPGEVCCAKAQRLGKRSAQRDLSNGQS